MTNNPHIFISYSTRDLDTMLDDGWIRICARRDVWIGESGHHQRRSKRTTIAEQAISKTLRNVEFRASNFAAR
ncbi:MAG: hypothetical protein U0694_15465 [Anaerolineae bacterium]